MNSYIVMFLLAAFFFGITVFLFKRSMDFQKHGIKVEAKIAALDIRTHKKHKSYYPIFQYTVDGQEYFTEGAHSGNFWKKKVNGFYPIYYDPTNPKRIQVLDFSGVFFWTCAFSCIGMVFFTIGIWKLWYHFMFTSQMVH